MKILVVCSTLDLSKPFGATPSLWQLFKAFYEEGAELLIIPYYGRSIDSVWWDGFQNPNYYKGKVLEKVLKLFGYSSRKKNKYIINRKNCTRCCKAKTVQSHK